MINPCDFFSRAEAAPLKSPCDQRERGRERAYEQSECAKASVAEAVRAERTTSDVEAKAEVERERAWHQPCERSDKMSKANSKATRRKQFGARANRARRIIRLILSNFSFPPSLFNPSLLSERGGSRASVHACDHRERADIGA